MKRVLQISALLTLAAIGSLWSSWGSPAQAVELKFLVSWGPNNETPTYTSKIIAEEVKRASNGAVTLKRFGPEVVPPFEQLQPVSAGAFDVLMTHPAYHGGATPIGALIDTIATDNDLRRSTGVFDWLDQYYQKKFNVKLLATPTQTGYQFVLKEPLKGDEGLKGRKIRSNPAYDPIITKLGGSPVLLPAPQIFTGLQKGLIDGSAYTVNSLAKQKLHEVVKYMARPTFGAGNYFFLVNLDKWRSMDSKTKDALLAAAKKSEAVLPWFAERMKLIDEEQMIIHGVRYTYFDPDNAARLTTLFNEGLWQQAVKKGGADAEEFVKLVKSKGMANK